MVVARLELELVDEKVAMDGMIGGKDDGSEAAEEGVAVRRLLVVSCWLLVGGS